MLVMAWGLGVRAPLLSSLAPRPDASLPMASPPSSSCKDCGGYVKIIACIEDPVVVDKILRHLERKDATVTLHSPPSRGPPQVSLFG